MLRRAVSLKFGQAALIPKLHGQADDRAALLLQNGGNGGRVHAAGHGDGDEAGMSFRADGKRRFELGDFRHFPVHLQFNLRAGFCADVASDEPWQVAGSAKASWGVLCSKRY